MPLTAVFILASMAAPFGNGQLEPYVRQLCQAAAGNALPANVSSTAALQSAAVCFFVYSDMPSAEQPAKNCNAVVAALAPSDHEIAMDVCEAAGELTRNWANGRF
ncbi:hypothetical protein NKH34_08935 [Mesorhizobium sp. M1148]|uniref:hypothetical protein n=1 Tax=unclassified Mesorhizobium TaxID=325217 RepID=UPI0003CE0CDE|nr:MULTISPECIES: hypothetical protein [unclassified Mesorhizobium]ESX22200.1 hypothetical protein X766_00230 [Mesorhizobium sp. LSJC255A00]ESX28553.1 hypothetical protein X765_16975 [Mesorhizobium sp. LSHC440B00]ESX42500.1 hypothetical protein X764_10755 [Mesorhizobium sp. LSHC440A00]WJI57449.1 hypothetical protein NLY33_01435 [Mesorhizobium sp. C432A]